MPTPAFTYAGPSTAAAFTAGVYNLAWDLAIKEADDTKLYVDKAAAYATVPAQFVPGGVNQSLAMPTKPSAPIYDPNAVDARFDAKTNQVIQLLVSNFTSFLTTYFPTSEYLNYAQTWIDNVFTVGGTSFKPAVEDQIWQRERQRLVVDASRAQDETLAIWANRGYPLPPGAANGAVLRIQQDLVGAVASSSRERAIKAAEIEIENLRFATQQAINLRMQSINVADAYIRSIALGPSTGVQVASTASDAQVRMEQTITQLYSAEVAATELPIRLRLTDAELRERAAESNLHASVEAQHDRVTAAVSAAHALGNIASAAVNSLHAQTGITANESL